jgi:hypothetical protein
MIQTTIDITCDDFIVKSSAQLPDNTKIGQVTKDNIKHLKGLNENINDALNNLKSTVNFKTNGLNNVSKIVLTKSMYGEEKDKPKNPVPGQLFFKLSQ